MSTKKNYKAYRNVISIPHAILRNERTIHLHENTYLIDHINADNLPKGKNRINCLILILCEKGEIRYEYGGRTYHAYANDLLCLFQPQTIDACKIISKEYEGKAIMLDSKLLYKLAEGYETPAFLYWKITRIHKVSLEAKDVIFFNTSYKGIKFFLSSQKYYKKELSQNTQQLIIHTLLADKNDQEYQQDEDKYCFDLFEQEVELEMRHTRQVKKYCDLLNIPIHTLERIVHKYANMSPKEFINYKLIKYVCTIIESTNMTNHEIAHYLNFSDLSTLCRLFKSKMKKSISTYRREVRAQRHCIAQYTTPCQSVL